jgi:hypothetical protein
MHVGSSLEDIGFWRNELKSNDASTFAWHLYHIYGSPFEVLHSSTQIVGLWVMLWPIITAKGSAGLRYCKKKNQKTNETKQTKHPPDQKSRKKGVERNQ